MIFNGASVALYSKAGTVSVVDAGRSRHEGVGHAGVPMEDGSASLLHSVPRHLQVVYSTALGTSLRLVDNGCAVWRNDWKSRTSKFVLI